LSSLMGRGILCAAHDATKKGEGTADYADLRRFRTNLSA
jgi:hypothetical protein